MLIATSGAIKKNQGKGLPLFIAGHGFKNALFVGGLDYST